MRIGISLASAHPGTADGDAVNHMLARARVARDAGVTSITVGDHHATGPMPYVQNIPFLGRLLAEWDGPVGCLFLAPGWSPVLLAEQVGTLASMTDAPFIVQTGLGGPDLPATLGQTVSHRGRRLEHVVVTAQALLRGERVTDDELGLDDVAVAPLPRTEPEWWIGAHADAALDRAARIGTGWYGDAGVGPDTARSQMATYRAACETHGSAPGTMAIRRDVIISADGASATALGDQLIDAGYRGGMPRDAVAYGSPAEVADQLGTYADMGFTDVIVRVMVGTPQDLALETCAQLEAVAASLGGS